MKNPKAELNHWSATLWERVSNHARSVSVPFTVRSVRMSEESPSLACMFAPLKRLDCKMFCSPFIALDFPKRSLGKFQGKKVNWSLSNSWMLENSSRLFFETNISTIAWRRTIFGLARINSTPSQWTLHISCLPLAVDFLKFKSHNHF